MTFPNQESSLAAGDRLVAPGTPLPPEWRIENSSRRSGWSCLANALDDKQLDTELTGSAWTFFFMANRITAAAFGFSAPGMLDTALARLITAARLQKCNCVEIDDVSMRSFLGLPYLRLSAHPRHIQKGSVFSGQ